MTTRIYTIGFAKKSAQEFFDRLKSAGIKRLVDVRLNNTSQLAGFTKRGDLAYFLEGLCGIEYLHAPSLAPTQDILDAYKKTKGAWADYETAFRALMTERHIENELDRALFKPPTVLLCSEPEAEHCHRRLVVEYLREHWGPIEQIDL
jgi:uncharacterized protein (DUF488 family)